MRLFRQINTISRGAISLAKAGFPSPLLMVHGGIGDEFLLTTVIKQWHETHGNKIDVATGYPELFQNNPDVGKVVHATREVTRLAPYILKTLEPYYPKPVDATPPGSIPSKHIAAHMCESIGLTIPKTIKPYIYLSEEELQWASHAQGKIIIQSSGVAARFHMKNKEWGAHRFQKVVNATSAEYQYIQVGSPKDPLIDGALDLRGKTSIRQTTALLAQAKAYLGLASLVMHLARSVDCASLVIFGGREKWWQTGYERNINFETNPECSPCWQENLCNFDRRCLSEISEDSVIAAIKNLS